jgi:hypothetical protein
MTAWLDENCGADGWAMTPSGTRGVLNDAVSITSPTQRSPVHSSRAGASPIGAETAEGGLHGARGGEAAEHRLHRRAGDQGKGLRRCRQRARAAIREQTLNALRAFRKRGAVEQMGLRRGLRWKLASV